MLIRLLATLFALMTIAPVQAAERSFLVGNFEDVIVEGDIQVTLKTGLAPSAKASGDRDRLGALKIIRQGQVVRIRMQGLAANRVGGEPLQVALTGRNVKKMILQGNGRITASGLDMPQLRLEIRGSGEIDIAKVKSDRLVALLVGSGKLTLGSGSVTETEILIDGSPVISAPLVEMQKLRLQQNGPAKTHFKVGNIAEITNSGTGNITIDGKGTCQIRQAGAATIKCTKTG
jgi:hypothetical protein